MPGVAGMTPEEFDKWRLVQLIELHKEAKQHLETDQDRDTFVYLPLVLARAKRSCPKN